MALSTNASSCSPRPSTPDRPSRVTGGSPSSRKSPRSPLSSKNRSPKTPGNAARIEEQQRRIFMEHLTKWSVNHDSNPYFNGKLNLVAPVESVESIALGKSVKCVLTDNSRPEAQKQIVIRLFQERGTDAKYKMVVRYGAGWIGSREFLGTVHMGVQREEQEKKLRNVGHFVGSLNSKFEALEAECVVIRPLFRPFLRLPLELQQMVLATAAGITGTYRPCCERSSDPFGRRRFRIPPVKRKSPISIATVMKISKSMNEHVVPWLYHSTDFHFELTGFTNFLWLSGPHRRPEIKRITLQFSEMALLHCLRWLAPDPVFTLFHPQVITTPPALRYLWRCQIQDLAKEVHLSVLTIDINHTPVADIPMVVRILRHAFGGVRDLRFKDNGVLLGKADKRLEGLERKESWREMCKGWFERQRRDPYSMARERARSGITGLEKDMDADKAFFDAVDEGVDGMAKWWL